MIRTISVVSPAGASASPFRLDATVAELYGEAVYAEPEVPDRELEEFEALQEFVGEHLEHTSAGLFENELESESEHPVSRLFRVPIAALEALGKGAYTAALTLLGTAGYANVNDLTNIIFYFRHPAVIGRKIQPSELDLQRDWLRIRDTIVRPALADRASATPPVTPATSTGSGRTSISSAGLEWYGAEGSTPPPMAFMRAVYDLHVSMSKGPFVDTLPDSALKKFEGGHRLQKAAADSAVALLEAARADREKPGSVAIGITSAYRSASRQFEIWQGKGANGRLGFPHYYDTTRGQRAATQDAHGPIAVALLAREMKRYIAAPGYSNHQDGLAIDFGTGAAGGGLRKLKRKDWFYKWLVENAGCYDFVPYRAEAWHWVYRPQPTGKKDCRGGKGTVSGESEAAWIPEAAWEGEEAVGGLDPEWEAEAEWEEETGQDSEAEWEEETEQDPESEWFDETEHDPESEWPDEDQDLEAEWKDESENDPGAEREAQEEPEYEDELLEDELNRIDEGAFGAESAMLTAPLAAAFLGGLAGGLDAASPVGEVLLLKLFRADADAAGIDLRGVELLPMRLHDNDEAFRSIGFLAWTNSSKRVYVNVPDFVKILTDDGARSLISLITDPIAHQRLAKTRAFGVYVMEHEARHVRQFRNGGGRPPADFKAMIAFESHAYGGDRVWLKRPGVKKFLLERIGARQEDLDELLQSATSTEVQFLAWRTDTRLNSETKRRDAMKGKQFLPDAIRDSADYKVGDLYRTKAP
ncbi:M15 family metallopeptidase [Agromyces bauzanensis]